MFAKEVASIREFGFIDPVTVRPFGKVWQIIDGEHRVRAAESLHIASIPCVVVDVDDDTAKQLTIVLNETRGTADRDKMAELVRDLATRFDLMALTQVLPINTERLSEILGERQKLDFASLGSGIGKGRVEYFVERVYRMPRDAATVLDEAVAKVREEEGLKHDWQSLEVMAAERMAS